MNYSNVATIGIPAAVGAATGLPALGFDGGFSFLVAALTVAAVFSAFVLVSLVLRRTGKYGIEKRQ
ncbi:MAG: FAM174 family membrane protein [Coriobacteriaceae bacterium]|jgi:hypothetical protein|nr:FAM174 family membrane protein [Coriobacteriaceae bacterium]